MGPDFGMVRKYYRKEDYKKIRKIIIKNKEKRENRKRVVRLAFRELTELSQFVIMLSSKSLVSPK